MAFKFVPWTPADAVETYFDSKGRQIRANAFDLADMVATNATFFYVDDVLCCQDIFGDKLRHNLSDKGLENYILRFYGEFVRVNSSLTVVKQCAKILVSCEYPQHSSASKNNFLCLSNGYINLQNLPTISCHSYFFGNSFPYDTFRLNCKWPVNVCSQLWDEFSTQYNPQVFVCREMDDFVSRIADKNSKVIARIWEMLGYLLSPFSAKQNLAF